MNGVMERSKDEYFLVIFVIHNNQWRRILLKEREEIVSEKWKRIMKMLKKRRREKRKKKVFELFSFGLFYCCSLIRNILFIDLDTIYFDYEGMNSTMKIRKTFEM